MQSFADLAVLVIFFILSGELSDLPPLFFTDLSTLDYSVGGVSTYITANLNVAS